MEVDEMGKKKTVLSDIKYHIIFGTRKQNKILEKADLTTVLADNELYFSENDVKVENSDIIDDGAAVYLELSIPADVAISNVVFNIKRNSFKNLYKITRIKEKLMGERSIWSRDFAISGKGKYTAFALYQELPEIKSVTDKAGVIDDKA